MKLAGQICVRTREPASKFVKSVTGMIAEGLAEEKAGRITQTSTKVEFRRGYNVFPGEASRLAAYDPGEICVSAKDHELLVSYRLGLWPGFISLFLMGASLILLFVLAPAGLTAVLASLAATLFAAIFVFSLVRLRLWLKKIAIHAIDRESQLEDSRPQ